MRNPFDLNYTKQEIEFYGIKEYDNNGVKIIQESIYGRCDEFFNKAWFAESFNSLIMFIDGKLWMSLTPMEIQSHYLAIGRAEGKVGTGGLGMGYFALRVVGQDEVESLDVYEINENVINYFKANFSEREGFEKINFIHGDIFDNLKGKEYDFFFNDIYSEMTIDQNVISHRKKILKDNKIGLYQIWGEEKFILAGVLNRILTQRNVRIDERDLFSMWAKSENSRMYDNCYSEDDILEVLTAIKRIK